MKLQPLLLVMLVLILYRMTGTFDFVNLDDASCVYMNPRVMSGLSLDNIQWAFSTFHYANWMPVTWLSYMVDAEIWKQWAGGYHLTNVALHLANVLLVYSIFKAYEGPSHYGRSFFIAALFAIHPLNVESVCWVSERKGLLATIFGLLSIRAYAINSRRGSRTALAIAVGCFALSIMSKQSLVALPLLLLLLDVLGGRRPSRQRITEKIPFLVLMVFACAIAPMAQYLDEGLRDTVDYPLYERVTVPFANYGLYVWRAIVPIGLTCAYSFTKHNISVPAVTLGYAFVLLMTVLAIKYWAKLPWLAFGWAWYSLSMLPVIGFIPVGTTPTADRYAYFPMIGMFLIVSCIGYRLLGSLKGVRLATGAALVVVYGLASVQQVGYWHDSVSLFRHAVAATDGSSPLATRQLAIAIHWHQDGEHDIQD